MKNSSTTFEKNQIDRDIKCKKATKYKIVESEMGVWVMNLPLNYCWLVYMFEITLKLLNIF